MIPVPNIAGLAGVFTMGFGIMASMITDNIAAIGGLANGIMPLRKVAQIEVQKPHPQEMRRAHGVAREAV